MRLKTIWTMPLMSLTERLRRTVDLGAMKTAMKLPARIRYWATITEMAKATRDSPNIPGTPLEDILKNLSGGPK